MSRIHIRACLPLLLAVAIGGPAGLRAQHDHGSGGAPAPAEGSFPLYRAGLGPFSRPITTSVAEAQAYFDQGAQLMFAFAPSEAAKSFQEAQRRDLNCAMCYWGEAWAWGSYLNEPMEADDAPRAFDAIRRARDHLEHASPVERALIDAMAARYTREHDPDRRKRLDTAYAAAMADVLRRFPSDLDVATLYAEALMLLEPRRGRWDVAKPSVREIHRVLEATLDADLRHPGACHLFIHATESTVVPEKAVACAEHLGLAIPGASHINHMPSHTGNRVGRWGDAVRANIRAWHSDQRAAIGEGFAIYPSHNLHMLLFAASMDGQGAVAWQAARDYAKEVRGGVFYEALVLLRFGRFEEILALAAPPEAPIHRGLWEFARGYAQLRQGRSDSARVYWNRVRDAARDAPESVTFRGHSATHLLGIVGGILEGELLHAEGRAGEALVAFERSVETEDSLRYDEPEPLNFSARHWLGAALLDAGRPTEAEAVYRAALADHPNNGWSLLGLALALEAQGQGDAALAGRAEFERAWARADTWIRASRF